MINSDQRSPSISTEAFSGHPDRRLVLRFFDMFFPTRDFHLHLASNMLIISRAMNFLNPSFSKGTFMQSVAQIASVSKTSFWAGHIISAFMVLFLLFDGVIHLMKIDPVVKAFGELGYPVNLAVSLGILELICLLFYVIPRTSILGAILLTGYLGGAVATQLRIGNPLFSQALFPAYVGILVWGGLVLRDGWLRKLIPLRSGV